MSDSEFELHPVSKIFPMMSDADLDALAEDIEKNGLCEPILVDDQDQILDGRNRLEACRRAGVEPRFETWDGRQESVLDLVISLNVHRRHIDETQRAMVAARIARLQKGDNQHTSIDVPSQAQAAKLLSVGPSTVQRARTVQDYGVPELVAAVDRGKVKVSAAVEIARLPEDEQREVVAAGPAAIRKRAAKIRAEAKPVTEREANPTTPRAETSPTEDEPIRQDTDDAEDPGVAEPPPAGSPGAPPVFTASSLPPPDQTPVTEPSGKHRCIVIDPEWPADGGEPGASLALDLRELASPKDCMVLLWTPIPNLPDALHLFETWGIRYSCTLTWVMNTGLRRPPWMHSTHHVLVGQLGSNATSCVLARRTSFDAPVNRRHKPEDFYDLVRQVSAEPRVIIGAVDEPEGFEVWSELKNTTVEESVAAFSRIDHVRVLITRVS